MDFIISKTTHPILDIWLTKLALVLGNLCHMRPVEVVEVALTSTLACLLFFPTRNLWCDDVMQRIMRLVLS